MRATAGGAIGWEGIPISANVTCGKTGPKEISDTMISTGGSLRSGKSCGGGSDWRYSPPFSPPLLLVATSLWCVFPYFLLYDTSR